jgi:hypothetical protein
MSTPELLDAILDYRLELALWVLASILIYGVTVNLWHRLRQAPSSNLGRRLSTLENSPHSLWLFQALRFVYYLCIPYLALTHGVTSPTLMGMWAANWFHEAWLPELSLGLALGLGACLLLVWGWRRYLVAVREIENQAAPEPHLLERRMLGAPWGWGLILLEVLYLEIHWAFYRGAAIRAVGDYYGVFLGFLLVLAECSLNPAIRSSLGLARRGGETLTAVTVAFTISVIYYFTANLWLCIAVHIVMQFGLLSFLALSCGLPYHEGESH